MADNRIDIEITANQASLQSALTLAQTRLKEIQLELAKTASQMKDAGTNASAQLTARFNDLNKTMLETKIETANLAKELNDSVSATNKAAGGHGNLQIATAGSTREFIVLGHEALSGNFSRIPGSILVLAERMGNLHAIVAALATPFGLAVAAAAALAGGLAYLGIKAYEADQNLEHLALSAGFFGRADLGKENLKELADQLNKTYNTGETMANKLVGIGAQMKHGTQDTTAAISEFLVLWSKATGETLDEVSKKIGKDFEGDLSEHIEAFTKKMGNATAEQVADAKKFAETGDSFRSLTLMIDLLTDGVLRHKDAIDKTSPSLLERFVLMTAQGQADEAGASGIDFLAEREKEFKARVDSLIASLKERNALIAKTPTDDETKIVRADVAGEKINPQVKQAKDAQNAVDQLSAGLTALQNKWEAVAKAEPGPERTAEQAKLNDQINIMSRNLDVAREKLAEVNSGDVVAAARTNVAELGATWEKSHSSLLAASAAYYRQESQLAGISVGQRQQLEKLAATDEIAAKKAALEEGKRAAKEAGDAEIQAVRAKIAAIESDESKSVTERMRDELGLYQAEITGNKLTVEQKKTIQADYDSLVRRLRNTENGEALESVKKTTDSFKLGTQERITAARQEEALATDIWKQGSKQQIDATARVTAAVQAAADQEKRIRLEESQANIKVADLESKSTIKSIEDRYKYAQSSLVQETAALRAEENKRYALVLKAFADEEAAAQNDAVKLAAIRGKEKIAFQQHLDQEVAITRNAYAQQHAIAMTFTSALTSSFASGIQGMIEGTQTLKQAFASVISSMLGALLNFLADWAAKWLATAILNMLATSTTAEAQVASNAAVAGAAGTASAAAIPYIGWAIAPEAGQADFLAAMAYAPSSGLAVGAWDIPKNMNANLHQGEMVVPKTFAEGMRGGSGGMGDNYHFTINAVDSRSVKQMLMDHGSTLVQSLNNQRRNGVA